MKTSLYICFTKNLTTFNINSLFQDLNYNCLHCSAILHEHQCGKKPNVLNFNTDHNFKAIFEYSACPATYVGNLSKHEASLNDSGFIVYATYRESYIPLQIIEIRVGHHHYRYVVYVVLSGLLVTLIGITVFIRWLKRSFKKKKVTMGYSTPDLKSKCWHD